MTNLPTEIIRTICSFTKEWRFLHGRWINLSPLFLLKAPKTLKSTSIFLDEELAQMFFVEMQINSNKKFRLEYTEFIGFKLRSFRCMIEKIGGNFDLIELFHL
jgi:hypothetical protein